MHQCFDVALTSLWLIQILMSEAEGNGSSCIRCLCGSQKNHQGDVENVSNQWEKIINLGFFCIFDHVVPFTSCTLASKLFYAYHYVIRKNQLGCCRVICSAPKVPVPSSTGKSRFIEILWLGRSLGTSTRCLVRHLQPWRSSSGAKCSSSSKNCIKDATTRVFHCRQGIGMTMSQFFHKTGWYFSKGNFLRTIRESAYTKTWRWWRKPLFLGHHGQVFGVLRTYCNCNYCNFVDVNPVWDLMNWSAHSPNFFGGTSSCYYCLDCGYPVSGLFPSKPTWNWHSFWSGYDFQPQKSEVSRWANWLKEIQQISGL